MNINIQLTADQKKSVKESLFSELTALELAKELLTKISITEDFDTMTELRTALINYIKSK
jgi:hypothetical protein